MPTGSLDGVARLAALVPLSKKFDGCFIPTAFGCAI